MGIIRRTFNIILYVLRTYVAIQICSRYSNSGYLLEARIPNRTEPLTRSDVLLIPRPWAMFTRRTRERLGPPALISNMITELQDVRLGILEQVISDMVDGPHLMIIGINRACIRLQVCVPVPLRLVRVHLQLRHVRVFSMVNFGTYHKQ